MGIFQVEDAQRSEEEKACRSFVRMKLQTLRRNAGRKPHGARRTRETALSAHNALHPGHGKFSTASDHLLDEDRIRADLPIQK